MSIRDLHMNLKDLLDRLESKSIEFSRKASMVEKLKGDLKEAEQSQAEIAMEIVDIKGEVVRKLKVQ